MQISADSAPQAMKKPAFKKISLNKLAFLNFTTICVALLFTAFFNVGTAHAKTCYTLDEAEAEQGIRIHSELMIIGLNCSHIRKVGGPALFTKYRKFTDEHEHLFEYYEEQLVNYFTRQGSKNPQKELDTLRTEFANALATDVARMRPDVFCYRYASRIEDVEDLTTSNIRKWASTFYDSHPVSNPICEQ